MISVGIVGASGFTGEELVRLLLKHPDVSLDVLTSRTHAGKKVSDCIELETDLDKKFLDNNKVQVINKEKYYYTIKTRKEFLKYNENNNLIFENL